MSIIDINPFDKEIMARTAIGEARGEGPLGMQAVMWSGLNRFNAKKWFSGASIAGTFLKKEQYDAWMPDDPNYSVICNMTAEAGTLLAAALTWAEGVINGSIPDPTNGATHYFADYIDQPIWVHRSEFVVKIGRQSFYKGVA